MKKGISAIVLTLFLLSCSARNQNITFDESVDFSSLHSYQWVGDVSGDVRGRRINRTALDTRVRKAVETALDGRGFRPAMKDDADFLLSYQAGLRSSIGPGQPEEHFERSGSRWSGPDTMIRPGDKGTLVLNILDPGTRRPMWRGLARRILEGGESPSERQRIISEAIVEILNKFPPEV